MTLMKMMEIESDLYDYEDSTFTDLSAFYSASRFWVFNCYNAPSYIGFSRYEQGDASTSYSYVGRITRVYSFTGTGSCVNIKAFST